MGFVRSGADAEELKDLIAESKAIIAKLNDPDTAGDSEHMIALQARQAQIHERMKELGHVE